MRGSIIALALMATTATVAASASAPPQTRPGSDISSQTREAPPERARARTRIRVTPLRQPPNFHRRCAFHLAREVRASGAYVVPRERCWWEPYPPP